MGKKVAGWGLVILLLAGAGFWASIVLKNKETSEVQLITGFPQLPVFPKARLVSSAKEPTGNDEFYRADWQEEISVKQGITFSRDGTFTDEGFLSGAISTWWWADRGLVNAEFPPGKGTYRVVSNSLVLLYADGRKVRANFHLADPATKDNVTGFIISTRRFVKVK